MTTPKGPIHGAWTLVRINPWDGDTCIMGVFPEGKAALLRLEHIMTNPDDNEEYKLEYHVFPTVEQELESHQTCKANRAEWKEKDVVYENYKKEQAKVESDEIDKLLEDHYSEEDLSKVFESNSPISHEST